jgi:gliding motility-associated-like protein
MQKNILILIMLLASKLVFSQPNNLLPFSYRLLPSSNEKDLVNVQFIHSIPEEANSIVWNFGDGTSSTALHPKHIYNISMQDEFVVALTYTIDGEKVTYEQIVKTSHSPRAIKLDLTNIPEFFTPNGDNVNDYFELSVAAPAQLSFMVFSRTGAMVFQQDVNTIKWDGTNYNGKELTDGVYYYVIEDRGGVYNSVKGFFYIFRGKN